MTMVKKAINHLSNLKRLDSKEKEEIYDTAIEALEKQIAKKPEDIDEEYELFQCPNCNEWILCSDYKESHKYCLNCGQKIDWSEEK